MSPARVLSVVGLAVTPLFFGWLGEGCRHTDEDDDPKALSAAFAPSSAPSSTGDAVETPDAAVSATAASDAAPIDAADATAVAKINSGGISPCCNALRQSVRNASPEQQGAYLLAAAACDATAKSAKPQLAKLKGMLLGAPLPDLCK